MILSVCAKRRFLCLVARKRTKMRLPLTIAEENVKINQVINYREEMTMLTIKDGKFFRDGKEHKIWSGAIHYFRTLPEYWRDRLEKLKAAGFNTVET